MLHVAVIRGGSHPFFDASLAHGASALKHLDGERYTTHDIFVDKEGVWHRRGAQMRPVDALRGVDVVMPFLLEGDALLHTVLRDVERLQLPYTGSSRSGLQRAQAKHTAHEHLASSAQTGSLRIPPSYIVEKGSELASAPARAAQNIFVRFGPPYMIKPAHGAGSRHMRVAPTIHDVPRALEDTMRESDDSAVVQPYLRGDDASVYVIDGFRNQEHYTLPSVKVVIGDFDTHVTHEHKKNERAHVHVPAPFSHDIKKKLEDAAREVHHQLRLAHYSKIDFRVTPHGIYVLEANTHPAIGEQSMLASALDTVGASLKDFYAHIIDRAYRFKKPL